MIIFVHANRKKAHYDRFILIFANIVEILKKILKIFEKSVDLLFAVC